jgi:hypothetical protein
MGRRVERRCLRSQDTRTALSYQLAYSAVQSGMEGLVLADHHGILLGASPSTRCPEEIAAHCPLVMDPDVPLTRDLGEREDVTIHSFEMDGSRLFLAGLGGMASRRAVALARAMRGVIRILCTTTSIPGDPAAAASPASA